MSISNSYKTRLVLGTAQLGMDYGVANYTGQPSGNESFKIIQSAWENGIHEYETAQAYGTSEKILGEAFKYLNIGKRVRVISKIHPKVEYTNYEVLQKSVNTTLAQIQLKSLFGLLFHDERILDYWSEDIVKNILKLHKRGLVRFFGISVYSPKRAIEALSKEGISIIQVPSNILDRRFENIDFFNTAIEKKKKIYIRSVFLQGLLLLGNTNPPDNLEFAIPVLKKVQKLSKRLHLKSNELCLGYAKKAYPDAKIVVGIEKSSQINENIKIWNQKFPNSLLATIQHEFGSVDERILNPSLWKN